MPRSRAVVLALLVSVCAVPALAGAQDPASPLGAASRKTWGPLLDSLQLSFATRSLWRGYDLGSPAYEVGADLAIAGYPVTTTGRWGMSFDATARLVPDGRNATHFSDRIAAGARVLRRFADLDTLALLVNGYHLPDAQSNASGAELGVRLSGVEIPWMNEVRPSLDGAVIRDLGSFDATHAQVGIRQFVGIQRVAFWFGARSYWDDFTTRSFVQRALEAQLGANYDLMLRRSGAMQIGLTGGILFPNGDRTVGYGRTGIKYIH